MPCRLLVFLWSLLAAPVLAAVEAREFAHELERQRFQSLAAELRCPKCQNQSLMDSDAPIAVDLRAVLHEQLRAGHSDQEILAYMTARYGEFIRYSPDWRSPALVIWVLPVLLLLLGAAVLHRQLRRAATAVGEEGGA